MAERYDLIVLGGGPAGYNAAERAAEGGMRVLLFEERSLGGVCLNEGCIPTKTLLYSAKVLDYAHHGAPYGVTVEGASLDHAKVIQRKNKVVKTLVSGVFSQLKRAKVTVVTATAVLDGKTAEGFRVLSGGETYLAANVLVCTGSEAVVPPIPGLREAVASGLAMTNREILDNDRLPKHLCVIGGGVIGLEIASYYNSVGCQVTVVEMLDKIAGPTDKDISALLQKTYEKRGVRFLLGTKVTGVEGRPGAGAVVVEKDGKTDRIPCDLILVSTGRRPRTRGIGLETLGVVMDRAAIRTDDRCRTSVPGLWAAGDVNGKVMLAHTGYREGEVAVSNMLGRKDAVDYRSIPSVIYTNPEVASVGDTAESAAKAGVKFREVKVPMGYSGRYLAENEGGDGFVKLVVDEEHRRLLGVHMIGTYASEIIYGAAAMVAREERIDDIKKLVFPHPTVSEVLREGLYQL